MEPKIKSKSDFLHQPDWDQLYIIAEHWKSDIEFYRIESQFLRNLINKYFIWLIKDGNISKVQSLSNKLSKMINHKKEIYESINKHLMHLEELMENAFSHDEKVYRSEHMMLEDQFSKFVKEFRELKKEIFTVTEYIIEEEKIKHLLSS